MQQPDPQMIFACAFTYLFASLQSGLTPVQQLQPALYDDVQLNNPCAADGSVDVCLEF